MGRQSPPTTSAARSPPTSTAPRSLPRPAGRGRRLLHVVDQVAHGRRRTTAQFRAGRRGVAGLDHQNDQRPYFRRRQCHGRRRGECIGHGHLDPPGLGGWGGRGGGAGSAQGWPPTTSAARSPPTSTAPRSLPRPAASRSPPPPRRRSSRSRSAAPGRFRAGQLGVAGLDHQHDRRLCFRRRQGHGRRPDYYHYGD